MYLIGLFLLAVVTYFLFFNKKPTAQQTSKQTSSKSIATKRAPVSTGKQGATTFDHPIPTGFQIFSKNLPVAGMGYRKTDAIKFSQASNQDLRLEREPDNQHDKNAIRLIGLSGATEYFIGYLPKELSEQIVATGLFDSVKGRWCTISIDLYGDGLMLRTLA